MVSPKLKLNSLDMMHDTNLIFVPNAETLALSDIFVSKFTYEDFQRKAMA